VPFIDGAEWSNAQAMPWTPAPSMRMCVDDAAYRFHEAMKESQSYGFDKIRGGQQALGDRVRAM